MKIRIKLLILIFASLIVSIGGVYAASVLTSSSFKYTPSEDSIITSTNVQGALDELYTKANSASGSFGKVNSVTYDYLNKQNPNKNASGTDYKTLGHRILRATNGAQESLCLYNNDILNCFDKNNYVIESEHLKEMFKDVHFYTVVSIDESGFPQVGETIDNENDYCYICPESICTSEYIECVKRNKELNYTDYIIDIAKNGDVSIADFGEDNCSCYLQDSEEFDCQNMP